MFKIMIIKESESLKYKAAVNTLEARGHIITDEESIGELIEEIFRITGRSTSELNTTDRWLVRRLTVDIFKNPFRKNGKITL